MNKVYCVYFSPTGGTKQIAATVAEAMAQELSLPLEHIDITLPKAGTLWRMNAYKCGDNTSHPHWISWKKLKTITIRKASFPNTSV